MNENRCINILFEIKFRFNLLICAVFLVIFFTPCSLHAQKKTQRQTDIEKLRTLQKQDSINVATRQENNKRDQLAKQEQLKKDKYNDSVKLRQANERFQTALKQLEKEAIEREQEALRRKSEEDAQALKRIAKEDEKTEVRSLSKSGGFPFSTISKCFHLDSLADDLENNGQSIKAERTRTESKELLAKNFPTGKNFKIYGLKKEDFYNLSYNYESYSLYLYGEMDIYMYFFRKGNDVASEMVTSDFVIEKLEGISKDHKVELTIALVKKAKSNRSPVNYSAYETDAWHVPTVEISCKIISVKIIN